eukprot:TRINITY_DN2836_c0_g1_i2.p1 TRINITY_DN2836_c0_g1~~TRINITY_DN2836_c0_g1_i2.p1  ORF type:complete len:340 (+),score=72.93 TRINITY_DN2836_c0_g1_i2:479-1498(+)
MTTTPYSNFTSSYNDTVSDDSQQQLLIYQQLKEFEHIFLKVHEIAIICGCIGILGSLMTLLTVLSNRKLRQSHSHRLVAYLALADLLWLIVHLADHSTSYSHREFPIIPYQSLPGGARDSVECKVVGFLTQWFAMTVVFWPPLFPINIISRIEYQYAIPDWISITSTWGFFLVFAFIAIGSPVKYGGGFIFYCVFDDTEWSFYFNTIPILIAFFLTLVLYIYLGYLIFSSTHSSSNEKGKAKYRKIVYKLGIFPLIFLLTWLPAVIQAIWDRDNGPDESVPMDLIYVVIALANLGGFLNWIGYATTNTQIREIYFGLDQRKCHVRIDSWNIYRSQSNCH